MPTGAKGARLDHPYTLLLLVALPIIVTFIATSSINATSLNKRLDDLWGDFNRQFVDLSRNMDRRFDEVIKRLGTI